MKSDQMRLLLAGLAAGDCIGSLVEHRPWSIVAERYERHKGAGWPFRAVASGMWTEGEPTDDTDMAMAIIRAYWRATKWDPRVIAEKFAEWLQAGPKDIGATTSVAINRYISGASWFLAGRPHWERNPHNSANGSLMRNGVVPAFATDELDLITKTVEHAIITHFDPLSVLCCCIHSYLIWDLLHGRESVDWYEELRELWRTWESSGLSPELQSWLTDVRTHPTAGDTLSMAWDYIEKNGALLTTMPEERDFQAGQGYSFLTLRVAMWAAEWAMKGEPYTGIIPEPLPKEPFQETGARTLGWVAMLGYDADTYGSCAGPLVAAVLGNLDGIELGNLQALKEYDRERP